MGGCMDRLRLNLVMLMKLWVLESLAKGAVLKSSNNKCTGQVNFKFGRYVRDNEVNSILNARSFNRFQHWNSFR